MHAACDKPTYLFVLPWPLPSVGGANQVVMSLYRECERSERFRPLILTLDFHQVTPAFETVGGFRCVRLCVAAPASTGITARGVLAFLRRAPATLWRLHRLLSQHRVRVINAHYPTLSLVHFVVLRRLGLLRNTRLILSFHGSDVRNAAQQTGFERTLWRWMVSAADRLVSCSDALCADVRRFAAEPPATPVTVRNGVDAESLLGRFADAGISPEGAAPRAYLLNIGSFDRNKGQEVLVEAFSRLASDFPNVDLVILGRDGPARAEIERMIRDLNLGGRVTCLVNVPHGATLCQLRNAMLFVLPSRAEGLPLVILEAGALGIPVVASRVGGIPEVIDSDELGLLVASGDAAGLETAVRALIADDGLRKRLGRSLQHHVIANFSWTRAWAQYDAMID